MDGTNTPIYAEPANTDTLKINKLKKINVNIVSLYHKCFPPSVHPTQFNDPLFTNCSEYHFLPYMLLSRLRKTSISINFPSVNKHYLYWQHAPCLDPATSSFPWQYFSSLLSCFLFSLSRSLKQPWLSVFLSFVLLEAIKTVGRK